MTFALHGLLVRYSNVLTDIMLGAEAGYDSVELHTDKLDRFLASGLGSGEINAALRDHNTSVTCIGIIPDAETQDARKLDGVLRKTEALSRTAQEICCETIQVNAFTELADRSYAENIKLTAANIRRICEIGAQYGIRFQYEGAAWTPIHSLRQCLDLVHEVAMDNFALVLDYWHMWASRETTADEIAQVNKDLIYGVHLTDGLRPEPGEPWPDETLLRDELPGDGKLPCAEWTAAVKATGYDGSWSPEILGRTLWEANLPGIARDALGRLQALVAGA